MVETPYFWIFLIVLPIVAFLYAGVGHGGASGYLALMSLFSIAPDTMKPTALLLNLFVAGISFIYYYRGGYFNRKLFLYVAISSIPMAFLGGMIDIDAAIYKKILGVLLVFAIIKMSSIFTIERGYIREIKLWQGLVIGALIGFFSGLIGIGGGIVLSPIILLFHWGKIKEAAAVSALFIWVNSIAGLVGQFSQGAILNDQALLMVGLALIGGMLGSYFGSNKMSSNTVRYMLIAVLLAASLKLFFL